MTSMRRGQYGHALIAKIDSRLAPNWICALVSVSDQAIRVQLQRRSDDEYGLPGGLRCVEAATFHEALDEADRLTHAVGENWLEGT